MSHQQFYETVQLEEEYMSKMKSFVDELRTEFTLSEQEYCCYCGNEKAEGPCCGEEHFVTFADLGEDVQNVILDAEIKYYEESTK